MRQWQKIKMKSEKLWNLPSIFGIALLRKLKKAKEIMKNCEKDMKQYEKIIQTSFRSMESYVKLGMIWNWGKVLWQTNQETC